MHELFQSLSELPSAVLPFLYATGSLALLICLLGTLNRMSIWLKGRDEPSSGLYPLHPARILWLSLTRMFDPDCLFARRVFAYSRLRGVMVSLIVWSAITLGIGVMTSAVTFATSSELEETLDQVFGLAMDVSGGILALGLLIALGRRFIFRPARYVSLPGDAAVLILFFITVLSGLVLESTHIAEQMAPHADVHALAMRNVPPLLPPLHIPEQPQWYWQPFGWLIAQIELALGLEAETFESMHPAAYLFHAGSAFVLIAYLPFSKLFHMFAAQITTLARRQRPTRAAYPLQPRSSENR